MNASVTPIPFETPKEGIKATKMMMMMLLLRTVFSWLPAQHQAVIQILGTVIELYVLALKLKIY